MKIGDVAERSGFSPPTLRYYEEIGLLPEPVRTPSGYRTYDEVTLERLAFIARAKQLGCTLDEIADLTTAWEGGRCGPVQGRLRALVADKLTATRAQIVELTTLSNELQRAATGLERHGPDGPCDDTCGCMADNGPARPTTIALTAKPAAVEAPIACTLQPDALRGQLGDWHALLGHAVERAPLEDGVRVEFTTDVPVGELMRLVAAEQSCCEFLRFAITVDNRGIGLEACGPADARPIIDALFGAPA